MFEEVAKEGKEVVIMDNFTMNMPSPAASRSPLQTTAIECNFRQLIIEPTHHRTHSSQNPLKSHTAVKLLLFVSHPEMLERAGQLCRRAEQ